MCLAVLLLTPRREWALYIAGMGLAYAAAFALTGMVFWGAILISIVHVLEAVLTIELILRIVHAPIRLHTFREVVALVAASLISSSVSAGLGALVLYNTGHWSASFGLLVQSWWVTTLLGLLGFAPILTTGAAAFQEYRGLPRTRWLELICLTVCMIGSSLLTFSRTPAPLSAELTLTNLPFPFLMWAAFRFGPFGVMVSWFLLAICSLIFTLNNQGPMMLIMGIPEQRLLWLHTYLNAAAFFGLLVAAVVREYHRTQEALRQEAQCRAIFGNVNTGIGVLDRQGRYVQVNRRFAEMLGYTESELLATSYATITYPEDLAKSERLIHMLLEGSLDSYRMEKRFLRKDGGVTWGDVSVTPLCGPGKGIEAVVAVMSDISERKQAEEEQRRLEAQMQHAQKLESLGVLAGGIAHDFNNLLMGILGNADLAMMELPVDSPGRNYIKEVETGALRAADLCRQLLAYSGKGPSIVHIVSLPDLVREMAHLLEISVSKKATLRYEFPPNLPPIEADPTQIRQIIMNLITNASDALGDQSGIIYVGTGAVECTAKSLSDAYLGDELAPGYYVYLEVADTGAGMTSDQIERIFEPFFTTKTTGRGLGLSAVMGIVRKHHGAIRVTSHSGKGTTFRVLFPISDQPIPETVTAETFTWSRPQSGMILVIDDEETVCVLAKRMLEPMGFAVITARDGEEGVALYKEHSETVLAVLLDLMMPTMGGDETLDALHALRGDLPIILSSGFTEQEVLARFKGRHSYSAFLQKPYRSKDLYAVLQRVLGE